ncbi:hypothetical protein [Streptomyces luteireticuli]|uniref:hypothetical protein n=1 Tax=Streptomyces luteireticuli TaxID=173858 RepID=UPI0035590C3B
MNPDQYSEIKAWAADYPEGVDYVDFLTRNCTVGHWLAFCRVLWPRFVLERGCVLWDRVYEPAGFDAWYRHLDGDVRRVEATLNRLVVADIIDADETREDDDALEEIAETVGRAWRAALSSAYPDREFEVRVDDTDDGPVVSFVSVGVPGAGTG